VHIESLDYHVVSWQKYRDMRDEEERREYQRKWVAAKRASERKAVDKSCRQESTAIDGRQMSTKSTKAEAEAVKEKEDAANAAVVDVWRYGVDLLAGVGMTAAQARTFVGKLCRDWGEADVHDALMAATGKADPRSYARKWLEGRPKKGEAPPGVVFKHGQPTIGGFVA
jgi:hypothetical protein